MEKVIPPGLNYADIKPEAIENQIRMVRFLPQSNIRDQKPNDVIRFQLQGNGFYDPYSAYIKIQVAVNDADIVAPTAAAPLSGMFLDRSAHSLINRLVIRSQGTELERIEQYDVMAAMVNDMCYSQEQRLLHHYEGFASKTMTNTLPQENCSINKQALQMIPFLNADGPDPTCNAFGDRGFYKLYIPSQAANGAANLADNQQLVNDASATYATSITNPIGLNPDGSVITYGYLSNTLVPGAATTLTNDNDSIGWVTGGLGAASGVLTGPQTMEFCIPIYSGIIGVMMPDKKLLPLSLLPLEVEFTLNPHAFYPVGNTTGRSYTIKTFEIWTHTLFFEQELHRSLEAVVAEAGIFLHYESFYLTPVNTYATQAMSKFQQLGCYLKSVEAIHWVFLYTDWYQRAVDGARKLHFVSHNLTNLQLRNGMDLIPSEPIPSKASTRQFGAAGVAGGHSQLLIETYKGWNKMHDPLSDSAINPFNYQIDQPIQAKPTSIMAFIRQQQLLGRCQYALSLVGEELGQNKTIVSGKKTVMPFDLNFDASKSVNGTSVMFSFLRADFIVYVRPDLIVTRLGI